MLLNYEDEVIVIENILSEKSALLQISPVQYERKVRGDSDNSTFYYYLIIIMAIIIKNVF